MANFDLKKYLAEGRLNENVINENLSFDYQEDKILMDDNTKDAILDDPELQEFITPKSFVRNKKGQTLLWVDWMDYDQFDKLAKFLGIKY